MTTGWLWAAVPVVPLVVAALLVGRPGHRLALALAPSAAVPAFALAALVPLGSRVESPLLLLGSSFALDGTALTFLLLTATLWTAAGVYAVGHLPERAARRRYFLFHLPAMAGNLGLTLAADLVSFYLFFAVMTFSAYGLVVHAGSGAALRAGRVYITMAIAAEAMLLAGMLLAADAADGVAFEGLGRVADSPHRHLVIALLLAGFGVKAGAVPLHVWLPLAHPVAPTPASAVLSGAMIKAGLLGWLRFLPIGGGELPGWMTVALVAGVVAALFAAAVGTLQDDPKTVLAYSSISQMGWMSVGVGVALGSPEHAPAATAAVVLFAAHHGLAKAALFLGTGLARGASRAGPLRLAVRIGLLVSALSLAGAPLTSGELAKGRLKEAGALLPWPSWVEPLLWVAGVATAVILTRFLLLVWGGGRGDGVGGDGAAREDSTLARGALWLPWASLVALTAGFAPGAGAVLGASWLPESAGAALVGLLPVGLGALLGWGMSRGAVRRRLPRIAPGDVLSVGARVLTEGRNVARSLAGHFRRHTEPSRDALRAHARAGWRAAPFQAAEDALEPWLVTGALFIFLAALLLARLVTL